MSLQAPHSVVGMREWRLPPSSGLEPWRRGSFDREVRPLSRLSKDLTNTSVLGTRPEVFRPLSRCYSVLVKEDYKWQWRREITDPVLFFIKPGQETCPSPMECLNYRRVDLQGWEVFLFCPRGRDY